MPPNSVAFATFQQETSDWNDAHPFKISSCLGRGRSFVLRGFLTFRHRQRPFFHDNIVDS
jgi:hypothetical protein